MTVTGAFLTGCPVAASRANYADLQQRLRSWLNERYQWETTSIAEDGGTYHSGGGFERELPMVLLTRMGGQTVSQFEIALEKARPADRGHFGEDLHGWRLGVSGLSIEVYDLGMAVLSIELHVTVPSQVSMTSAADLLKRAVWLRPRNGEQATTPFVEAIRRLCIQTTAELQESLLAVAPETRQRPWTVGLDSDDPSDAGRLLWLHPLHILQVNTSGELGPAAVALAPAFHRMVNLARGCFVTGIGWSALILTPDSDEEATVHRLIGLQWAYIALYMDIDRSLLRLLSDHRWTRLDPVRDLEEDADQVFTDYIRVMEARSRADSVLAGLGGDEQVIWDRMDEVTRLSAIIDGVDRKIDVLQKIANRRAQQGAAASARRASTILSFLTALTIVTVTVALVGSLLGNRSDAIGHTDLRIVIVLLALLLSITLYREAFRTRPRRAARFPNFSWPGRLHRRGKRAR